MLENRWAGSTLVWGRGGERMRFWEGLRVERQRECVGEEATWFPTASLSKRKRVMEHGGGVGWGGGRAEG